MKLTTEQKISMLILAGYEPRRLMQDARIIGDKGCIHSTNSRLRDIQWEHIGDWHQEYHDEYELSTWESLRAETIPDELIYEAIETTTG